MRIGEQDFDPMHLRGFRGDIEKLLDQPDEKQARPCPGCNHVCTTCGSTSCTCNCSYNCDEAPRMMSSEPEEFPIEAAIAPLVFAINTLRLTSPCWSCEGHYNRSGDLDKLPRVWFYARSLVYPDLIAELLSDMNIARKLSLPWQVCVVSWGDGLDFTFSIEPRINPTSKPELNSLRRDVRVIADSLLHDMKPKLRTRLQQINQILNTGGARKVG